MRTLKGVIHGRAVELTEDTGLMEGQEVRVTVEPVDARLPPGEGIRRSAGAWADDAAELDKYLEWNRQERKIDRPELES